MDVDDLEEDEPDISWRLRLIVSTGGEVNEIKDEMKGPVDEATI